MNRRSFFAAVVGGSVAPKVAVSPRLWSQPTLCRAAASKAGTIKIAEIIRAQAVMEKAAARAIWGPKP